MTFLNGYKTYIVCAVALAYAVTSYWSGSMDFNAAFQMALAALGGASVRHGIAKVG